jgi:hypothetical protein
MQLVAYGAQDVYLTGEPKVTFFQTAYKRHTNFAMETVQQTVTGNPNPGGLASVTLSRSGDLVGDMFVVLTPTSGQLTSNNVGPDTCWVAERAFTSVELYIGGQLIDKHYQLWFRLYAEVFMNDTKKQSYGKLTSCPGVNYPGGTLVTSPSPVYLPLMFFFNKNPGLYLPLIALQYHEVRLDFTISSRYGSYFSTNPFAVYANYVYLDTTERDRMAKTNHEYLIEQVQYVNGDPVGSTNENTPSVIRMNYNHPVKELIWCYQNPAASNNPKSLWNFSSSVSNVNMSVDPSKFASSATPFSPAHVGAPALYVPGPFVSNLYVTATTATGILSGGSIGAATLLAGSSIAVQSNVISGNVFWVESGVPQASSNAAYGVEVGPLHQAKIILNGTDRFIPQYGKYFNQYQTYQYHGGVPYPGIYVYSFALKPEDLQPSGTCNFSRIDMAQIAVNLKTGIPSVNQQMFAVNYNILRIQSGLGGLAFSN